MQLKIKMDQQSLFFQKIPYDLLAYTVYFSHKIVNLIQLQNRQLSILIIQFFIVSLMSNKIRESSKQSRKQRQNKDTSLNRPLLKIPRQEITVYNDRIQIGQKFSKLSSLNNLSTNPTFTEIPQSQKQIYFSQTDVVFKLVDKQKKIMLSRIYTYQKPFLEIHVEDNQQRKILHHILKKKWCQSGFQDQYCLKQEIGKGAMAKVYLIERKQDHKKFAAKIISLKTQCEKTYDTFINQTKILRILSSPHVVNLEGVFISQKKQLISILEYLNGGTLFQQLRQKKLKTQKDQFKAIKEITLGVQHLRQKRILHRDLKLQNIMIRLRQNGQKQYVITDFGLSNWMGERKILFQKCGTPGYLAPQILNEKKGICLLNHSTDIFSLGVLYHFIFMCQGIFPFEGSLKKVIELNKKAQFSLIQAKKQLHEKQFILIQNTLNIDPQQRPSSKQLLEKYLPELENYLNRKQSLKVHKKERQNKLIGSQKVKQQNPTQSFPEQKFPSYRKTALTVNSCKKSRIKTQIDQSIQQQDSRISIKSARKAFQSVMTKLSSSFSLSKKQKQTLKTKDKPQKREDMKSFVN